MAVKPVQDGRLFALWNAYKVVVYFAAVLGFLITSARKSYADSSSTSSSYTPGVSLTLYMFFLVVAKWLSIAYTTSCFPALSFVIPRTPQPTREFSIPDWPRTLTGKFLYAPVQPRRQLLPSASYPVFFYGTYRKCSDNRPPHSYLFLPLLPHPLLPQLLLRLCSVFCLLKSQLLLKPLSPFGREVTGRYGEG